MDRVDKAEAAAKAMASVDDDATLSQLAAAWVGAALGGAKVQVRVVALGIGCMWTCKLCMTGRSAGCGDQSCSATCQTT